MHNILFLKPNNRFVIATDAHRFAINSDQEKEMISKHPIAKHGHPMTPLYEVYSIKLGYLLINSPTVLANLSIGLC